MTMHKDPISNYIDQLLQSFANRMQTNTVLLILAVVTGVLSYVAVLIAAWFAMEQQSNAIAASLGIAVFTALSTLVLVAYKNYHDKREQEQQTQLQSEAIVNFARNAFTAAAKSNIPITPILAIAGMVVASDKVSAQPNRQITH